MGVSKNRDTPKSSILIGFSIINHPFWGTSIFGNIHIFQTKNNPASARKIFPISKVGDDDWIIGLYTGQCSTPQIILLNCLSHHASASKPTGHQICVSVLVRNWSSSIGLHPFARPTFSNRKCIYVMPPWWIFQPATC